MYDFYNPDPRLADRRKTGAVKWVKCPEGAIGMGIADMDFPVPEPILAALRERLEHPFFGYNISAGKLAPVIKRYYAEKYGAEIEEDWLTLVPAVMCGVNLGCITAGGSVMVCTPIYSHILSVPEDIGAEKIAVPMKREGGRYTFDFDAMEKAVTPDTRSFILCNPQNPTGRVFSREELGELAAFCRRHRLTLVADEIHCELVLEGTHTPAFTVMPENTIVLSAAGKICNIPGLPLAFAVIPDADLRDRFKKAAKGLFPMSANQMAVAATLKAYDGSCDMWKDELRAALRANRDYMEARIARIDGLSVNHNEGTYLAWIDCTGLGVEDPQGLFRAAGVVMNSGREFGAEGFVRLNFACPRGQLIEVLDRMERAVKSVK